MSLHLVHFWQERTRAAYGDVVRLEEENARLKAEVERLEKGIQPEGCNDAVGRAVELLLEKEKENARLKAEVERLTFDPLAYLDDNGEWMPRDTHLAAVERLEVRNAELVPEIARLQSEVERLRKAGDAMAGNLERFLNESISDCNWLRDGLSNWNAAKEGKPSV